MAPEIASLTSRQNVGESKQDEIAKMAARITGIVANTPMQYSQDLLGTLAKLTLQPKLQDIVDDVQRRNTDEITGADIFDMLSAIDSKETHVNRRFVEDQIELLNNEYVKFFAEMESAAGRFAAKRTELLNSEHLKRPIRPVSRFEISKIRTDDIRQQE